MNILYLNLHARKEPFTSHKKAQEKTWANSISSRTLWLVGVGKSTDLPSINGNELEIQIDEHFDNILEKSVKGVRWALENTDFDYIIRGNTSNYFDDCMLRNFLSKLNLDNHFAGSEIGNTEYNLDCLTNKGLYLSGTGIVLSRKTAELFQDINLEYYSGWPDDVAISHHISKSGIEFVRIPRGDVTDFKPIEFTTQYRVKSWSEVDYAVKRMQSLDKIIHSNQINGLISYVGFSVIEYWRYCLYFPIYRGLNCLRHVRQLYWISKSILFFPFRKFQRSKICLGHSHGYGAI